MNIQNFTFFSPLKLADWLAFYISACLKINKSQLDIFYWYFFFFFSFVLLQKNNQKIFFCNSRTLDILKKKSHFLTLKQPRIAGFPVWAELQLRMDRYSDGDPHQILCKEANKLIKIWVFKIAAFFCFIIFSFYVFDVYSCNWICSFAFSSWPASYWLHPLKPDPPGLRQQPTCHLPPPSHLPLNSETALYMGWTVKQWVYVVCE